MDKDKPRDLKMKGKVKEEQDEPKNSKIKKMAQELKIATVPPGFLFQPPRSVSPLPKKTKQQSSSVSISKRSGKRPIEVVDHQTPSSVLDSTLKLAEEIVGVYGKYIDHVIEMGRDRFKDEKNWRFDSTLCEGLANACVEKVQRVRDELEGMKKDLNYSKVGEIVDQLGNIHESFHRSPNINASAMPNCTKQQLVSCENELQHIKKQLHGITSRIRQLKTKKKPVATKHKNLRIGN